MQSKKKIRENVKDTVARCSSQQILDDVEVRTLIACWNAVHMPECITKDLCCVLFE